MSDQNLNPLAQAGALSAARPRFKFPPIPEECRQFATDPTVFVLVPITLGEEQRASARAESKKTGIAYEVMKEALYSVDGKVLGWDGPDSKELVVERCSPLVRDLMLKAYHHVHVVSEDVSKAFLAGMATEA
jgi:hypothetical protein